MSNDKIPAAIKIYFAENYVSVLKGLGEGYDAHMSLILLSPLMEALASAKGKSLLKSLEETFMSLRSVKIGEAKVQQDEEADENEEEAEEESSSESGETMFDLSFVGPSLFEIGADAEVPSPNRKILYLLSKSLEDLANLDGFDEGEDCCDHECMDDGECCQELSEGSEEESDEEEESDDEEEN